MEICSVVGCEKPVRCLGLCKSHHLRQWRYGSPLSGGPSRGQARQFILDHINHKGEDCLIWPFARNAKGYPDVRFKGMEHMLAHRVMCVLAHGEPPHAKMDAAHSCGKGQQGCINPRHLSWKFRVDNHADKQLHGTQLWGDQVHWAKLTREQAWVAKYGPHSQAHYARLFGVTPTAIQGIRAGRTWKGL